MSHDITASIIGRETASREMITSIIPAFRSAGMPVVKYRVTGQADACDDCGASLVVVADPSDQAADTMQRILVRSATRPLLFVVSGHCSADRVAYMQGLRDAHASVALTFWRERRCAIGMRTLPDPLSAHPEQVAAIDIHYGLATPSDLRESVDFALAVAQSTATMTSQLTGDRFEVKLLRKSHTTPVRLSLTPAATSATRIEVSGAFGQVVFTADDLPRRDTSLQWLLEEWKGALEIMSTASTGDDHASLDFYLAGRGLPTPAYEHAAADVVRRNEWLRAR